MTTFTTHLYVSDAGVVGYVKFIQDAPTLEHAIDVIAAWLVLNHQRVYIEDPRRVKPSALRVDLGKFAACLARAKSDVEAALRAGAERG